MSLVNFFMANNFFSEIAKQFNKTLFVENRYLLYLNGLRNTIIISLGALAVGLIIGTIIALFRYSNKKFGRFKIVNKFLNVYISFLRGTPIVLQLMIMSFIILTSSEPLFVAIISFGINSSAYVAEIIRGGLEAVDSGQIEAGRSLGLSTMQTMLHIILPQGVKNALPSMGNEFIALIKETSVVGYISILDITFAANRIQSRTLDAFLPLIISASLYLLLVYILTFFLRKMERRLSVSDRS